MKPLTAKQARFADEYLVDGNGTRAAVAAGYGMAGARVAATRALKNDNVRALIAARRAHDSRRLQIGRQEALEGLLEAIQQARAQCNPLAQISGWREIAKMLGFYEPERRRVDLTAGSAAELRRLEAMSDEQLLCLIAGARA